GRAAGGGRAHDARRSPESDRLARIPRRAASHAVTGGRARAPAQGDVSRRRVSLITQWPFATLQAQVGPDRSPVQGLAWRADREGAARLLDLPQEKSGEEIPHALSERRLRIGGRSLRGRWGLLGRRRTE